MADYRTNLDIESDRHERNRGPWVARRHYAVGDVVTSGGVYYVCVSGSHYSSAAFATDQATHWVARSSLMAAAGRVVLPNWAPNTDVFFNELRGVGSQLWRSNNERTTGATWDATEQGFWTRIQ